MLVLRTVSELIHAFVRITPGREKTGSSGPVSSAGRYTPCTDSLSRPIKRTYSAEVTSSLSNLPHHRRLRLFKRPVIILHPPVCVKGFSKKIHPFFRDFLLALWCFCKKWSRGAAPTPNLAYGPVSSTRRPERRPRESAWRQCLQADCCARWRRDSSPAISSPQRASIHWASRHRSR